jgi:hypothetical protein
MTMLKALRYLHEQLLGAAPSRLEGRQLEPRCLLWWIVVQMQGVAAVLSRSRQALFASAAAQALIATKSP